MRHAIFGCALAVVAALAPASAWAQLKLPAASPAAKVAQEVGLTDISIEYSSPAVKGRKIYGGLVPYGQPWRSGANAATKLTFSRDVTFGGKPVPAGTYAVVTLPTERGWTVILNSELGLWHGKTYDAKQDVVRVPATTTAVPHRERLTYLFSDTTDDSTRLDLEWEKLRVSVPIKVDTATHVKTSIRANVDGVWRAQANAARYLAEALKEYDQALRYADASIQTESTWFNNWVKAEILAQKGQYAEARRYAQVAWDLGQKAQNFFSRDAVAKALKEWKDKQ